MKKVLIVVPVVPAKPENHMNWLSLRDAVRTAIGSDVQVDMTSLTSLIFDIANDGSEVFDSRNNMDVASYDLVVIRNVGKALDLGIALAHYLRSKNVQMTDTYLETRGSGKLASAMLHVSHGLPMPRTVYASARLLGNYIETQESLTYPFILKADNGKKGRDNYLVRGKDELEQILKDNSEVRFIAQQFIENDGDFRALVMDGDISLVIKRIATGNSHLNNTSQGGSAELLDMSAFNENVQKDILKAAEVEALEVAGVDVIFDKNSGKHYFLEVNRAPQIGTGAFAEEKIAAYAQMIKSKVGN